MKNFFCQFYQKEWLFQQAMVAIPVIFICIFVVAFAAFAGEKEDLAMQYSKLSAVKAYYEAKVEKIVVDMAMIEKRFQQIKKEEIKNATPEKDNSVPVDPASGK